MTAKQRERAIEKVLRQFVRLHTGKRRLPPGTEVDVVTTRERKYGHDGMWLGELTVSFYIPGKVIKA